MIWDIVLDSDVKIRDDLKSQGPNYVCVYCVWFLGGVRQWRLKKESRIWGNHKHIIGMSSLNGLQLWSINTPTWFSRNWIWIIVDGSGAYQNVFFWLWNQLTWLSCPNKFACWPCHCYSQSTSVSSSYILYYLPFL